MGGLSPLEEPLLSSFPRPSKIADKYSIMALSPFPIAFPLRVMYGPELVVDSSLCAGLFFGGGFATPPSFQAVRSCAVYMHSLARQTLLYPDFGCGRPFFTRSEDLLVVRRTTLSRGSSSSVDFFHRCKGSFPPSFNSLRPSALTSSAPYMAAPFPPSRRRLPRFKFSSEKAFFPCYRSPSRRHEPLVFPF